VCHQLTHTGVPLEQAVGRHRLRPGSGFLAVKIITDGPTSVLHISDIKEKVMLSPSLCHTFMHMAMCCHSVCVRVRACVCVRACTVMICL
jgi:hypothetical protein